jgi:CO/xanthine dehydrogenase FAD-binding subunit
MPGFNVYVPLSLDDALRYLEGNPTDTLPIAGSTDLLPRIKRKQVSVRNLVDLSGLTVLKYIKRDQSKIRIGALSTIADLEEQRDDSASGRLLNDVTKKFGSPNIRSVATVGGNICAASSSEDLIPVLLALDAEVRAVSRNGAREMPLKEFIAAKRKTALQPDEILAEISFSELNARSACSFQKLGIRNTLIIALVSVAVLLEVDETRSNIKSARIALNRLRGKIPQRAESVEEELLGQRLNEQTIRNATEMLGDELMLTSDFRASAEYRHEAAKVLFRRALAECQASIIRK